MQQKASQNTQRLLTVKQAAEIVGVGVGTIYRVIEKRQLRICRLTSDIIRIDPKDLDAWIEASKE